MMEKVVHFQFDEEILEGALKTLALEIIDIMLKKNYSEGFNRYIILDSFLHRVLSAVSSKHVAFGLIIFPVSEATIIRDLSDKEKSEVLGEAFLIIFKQKIDKDDFEKGGYIKKAKELNFEEVFTDYFSKLLEFIFNLEDFENQLSASFLAKMRR